MPDNLVTDGVVVDVINAVVPDNLVTDGVVPQGTRSKTDDAKAGPNSFSKWQSPSTKELLGLADLLPLADLLASLTLLNRVPPLLHPVAGSTTFRPESNMEIKNVILFKKNTCLVISCLNVYVSVLS